MVMITNLVKHFKELPRLPSNSLPHCSRLKGVPHSEGESVMKLWSSLQKIILLATLTKDSFTLSCNKPE